MNLGNDTLQTRSKLMSSRCFINAYNLFSATLRNQAHRYKDISTFRSAVDNRWRRLSNEEKFEWVKRSNPEIKSTTVMQIPTPSDKSLEVNKKPTSWNR